MLACIARVRPCTTGGGRGRGRGRRSGAACPTSFSSFLLLGGGGGGSWALQASPLELPLACSQFSTVQVFNLPQVDLMNFRIEYVRPRSDRCLGRFRLLFFKGPFCKPLLSDWRPPLKILIYLCNIIFYWSQQAM